MYTYCSYPVIRVSEEIPEHHAVILAITHNQFRYALIIYMSLPCQQCNIST